MEKQRYRLLFSGFLTVSFIASGVLLSLFPVASAQSAQKVSVIASFDRYRTPTVPRARFSFTKDGQGRDIAGNLYFHQDVPHNVNPPRLRVIGMTRPVTALHRSNPSSVVVRGEAEQRYGGISGCSYRGSAVALLRDRYPSTGSRSFDDDFRVVFTPTPNQPIRVHCRRGNALPRRVEWTGRGWIQISLF